MSNDIIVRRFLPSDLKSCNDISIRIIKINPNNNFNLVLEYNKKIIGFCSAKKLNNILEIKSFLISLDFQSNGFGSIFLKEIEKIAKKNKVNFISIPQSSDGMPFYLDNGFTYENNDPLSTVLSKNI